MINILKESEKPSIKYVLFKRNNLSPKLLKNNRYIRLKKKKKKLKNKTLDSFLKVYINKYIKIINNKLKSKKKIF